MEKPHKCEECGYATVELSKLRRHIRTHTGVKILFKIFIYLINFLSIRKNRIHVLIVPTVVQIRLNLNVIYEFIQV